MEALNLYKPLLLASKLIGNFPFVEVQDLKSGKRQFKFKLNSVAAWYSIGVISLIITIQTALLLATNLENSGIKELQYELSTVGEFISAVFILIVPLGNLIVLLFIIASCNAFAKFVQNWQNFETLSLETFPGRGKHPFEALFSFRNRLAIVYLIFGFIPSMFYLAIVINVSTQLESTFAMIVVGIGNFSTNCMILREFCTVLMYRTISEALKQVHVGISENDGKVKYKDVQKWIVLVQVIRNQIRQAELALEMPEICSIVYLFIAVLCSAFIYYAAVSTGKNAEFISAGLYISAWVFSRIFLRAVMTEPIRREESMIVTVIQTYSQVVDLTTRLEMKILVDMIQSSPSQIQLCKIFNFNSVLILKIFTIVANYLIVLIQFENSGK